MTRITKPPSRRSTTPLCGKLHKQRSVSNQRRSVFPVIRDNRQSRGERPERQWQQVFKGDRQPASSFISEKCKWQRSRQPHPQKAPERLPRNRQGSKAATLQRIASAASGKSGDPLQPEPPDSAAASASRQEAGGTGGSTFCFPRRLCAAFDGRKRLPGSTRDKQQSNSPPPQTKAAQTATPQARKDDPTWS